MKKTYRGTCHCGSVAFECDLDLAAGTTRCNCSFCRKARFWMAFAKEGEFRLLRGKDALVDYRHTPDGKSEPFLHFYFCGRCGVRAFTEGGVLAEMGGSFHAVKVACLDDVPDDELAKAPIHFADGRNNAWDRSAEYRYI
jgi:hypothetical protein